MELSEELESPLRGEIFSVERLEEFSAYLATELKVSRDPKVSQPLIPRVRDNGKKLQRCYRQLTQAIHERRPIEPAAEWLVDNYYIVEEQLREILHDLPPQFYKELPKISLGELMGYPRIYAIAMALVAHTDSRVETETLRRFIGAFQKSCPLKIGELWALPITLRLVLVENLTRLSRRIIWDHTKGAEADAFADQLIANVVNELEFQRLISKIPDACSQSIHVQCSFIAQLAKRLRDQEPEHWPAMEALEGHLFSRSSSTEQVVHTEHQFQASSQVSVANVITSMRLLSSIDWRDFFESVSAVDRILEKDPSGSYSQMDFTTRNDYRQVVELVARRSGGSEVEVATKIVELAKLSNSTAARDARRAHVGYYLIGHGVSETEKIFPPKSSRRIPLLRRISPELAYFSLAGVLLVALLAVPILYSQKHGASFWVLLFVFLTVLVPISELAINIVNFILTNAIPPKRLPKLDLSSGIPIEGRTMVVIPCMILSKISVEELIEKLELHYLGNSYGQLYFALLTDFADSEQEVLEEDQVTLRAAEEGIRSLNIKYAGIAVEDHANDRFFVFHRHRKWNSGEQKWMGWERKRGKLQEFNRLLRGYQDTSFLWNVATPNFLSTIRYVITLDADTQLPRDAARKLIGTAMHPLNRPHFDRDLGRVTEGYGIFQPRISVSVESSARSIFAKMFSGQVGPDPYTTAALDIYQDLFHEGNYTGKGLYDLDAFAASLEGRVPENTVLSHDLFEGLYARAALVTDVEFLEDYPRTYQAFFIRQHRWTRGDWQIARWVLPFVPNARNKLVRNRLPFLARWKIFDNLRRSLVAPATLWWFLSGWVLLPGSDFFWIGSALLIVGFPCVACVALELLALGDRARKAGISEMAVGLRDCISQVALYLVFLPHHGFVQLSAISTAFYRLLISKRNLMDWSTAAQVEAKGEVAPFWQSHWPVEMFLLTIFCLFAWLKPNSAVVAIPFFLLWLSYPVVASWISRKSRRKVRQLDDCGRLLLREIARSTWNYFDTFVTAQENWLPPDNFQVEPRSVIAHRTSPTNIGLYAMSLSGARDLGYLTTAQFLHRLNATVRTLQKLPKHRGHFFNWYDTQSLLPLEPRYVSTVDSGNLAAYLIAVRQACLEIPQCPLVASATVQGLEDCLRIIEKELGGREQPRFQEIDRCRKSLPSTSIKSFFEWGSELREFQASLAALKTALPPEPKKADWVPDVLAWIELAMGQVSGVLEDLAQLAPWTSDPEYFGESGLSVEFLESLNRCPSLSALSIASSQVLETLETSKGVSAEIVASVRKSAEAVNLLLRDSRELSRTLYEIFAEMDFRFLMDKERGVFSIGFNVSENKPDSGLYNLLASEARVTSFIAIAKGDAHQEHWFRLGRQLVPVGRERALISWSASMFEYLMPLLVMRDYENTLLDETFHTVVERQISYGKEHQVPWGVSEAGYNARDLQFNYQYGPFGIPGLGLKRGLGHDLVISPYSTLLAALLDPEAAIKNLRQLINLGLLTTYGFFESIDYTAERRPENEKFAVIKSFMAHHQGMSLVAIDNLINAQVMQGRFHREPMMMATRLLLQERVPRGVMPILTATAEAEVDGYARAGQSSYLRKYSDSNGSSPRVQLLSNGTYSVMVSTAGGGYSRCGDSAVTRWREDATRDNWGNFIFVKDLSEERVWSVTHQPMTKAIPQLYQVTFGEEKAEFLRKDGEVSTQTEILVAPEDNVEIRRVTLTNQSAQSRDFEITSYLEPVLSPPDNDLDHLAFSKLFLETEFLSARHTLLAKRRKRSGTDGEDWAVHGVVSDSNFVSEVQYETDRARFIGRGRSIRDPIALAAGTDLSNTVGATLDPVLCLRVRINVPAGGVARISFTTGVAQSRDEALGMADRYHDIHSFERESKLAWTQSRVDLQHLNITPESADLFQRVAEKIIYSDHFLRPPTQMLVRNTQKQSSLWPHGISGDLPILALSISNPADAHQVRKLLRCHEYLRLKGLAYEFVILNDHGVTYFQELQEELQRQVRTTGSHSWLNKRGGIFILRSDLTPESDRAHIQAVARVSLSAELPLSDQIDRKFTVDRIPALLPVTQRKKEHRVHELPLPRLQFFNEFGGFSEDGREYVISLSAGQWTPAPWINVIANRREFGFQVSECGSGFTWSINSQANRLTPWSNDPVSDAPGEIIYLRDEESGEVWTPTPLPIRGDSSYLIRHGIGYSIFEHESHGFHHTLTLFVPRDDTVKITRLTLKNLSGHKRKISVTSYAEWVLDNRREKSAHHLHCDVDRESGAIFARNPHDNDFSDRVAFADLSETERTFTCSRVDFLGRNGNYEEPVALKYQGLSGQQGTGRDPCAVLQATLEFQPHEQRELIALLGEAKNADMARALSLRYRDLNLVEASFKEVNEDWRTFVNTIQINTPEPTMDLMMNGWLLYQALSCRFWARSAFYQSGGAFGFRDQLQDSMAFVNAAPQLTRGHILTAAARQFPEGDVQHWWHPPSGRGIRTRISDDLLWLPYVVSFYVVATGDRSILTEVVPFLDAPTLKPEQEDSYLLPAVSKETATILNHCIRAIDRSLPLGEHGLPLMGAGDWNDGMNRVGCHGKGESVWLGWFLHKVISEFLLFCDSPELESKRKIYDAHRKNLKQALEDNGWDGDWYKRAFFDDGTPLGAASNEECRIDSIAQSWAVLSGAGDRVRSARAMKSVDELLVRKNSRLMLLLTPPFDKSAVDPGYIKGYVPGVRENGGQYTHAAIWALTANAELGEGERALELFNTLNPLNHALSKGDAETYRIEPYVVAGDVYEGNSHEGRGGWSWYTGSASWYYRAGLESILGLRLTGGKLHFEPCIPKEWKAYEIIYTYGKTKYFIKIENPQGVNRGAVEMTLDGIAVSEVALVDDASEHHLRVTLLAAPGSSVPPDAPKISADSDLSAS